MSACWNNFIGVGDFPEESWEDRDNDMVEIKVAQSTDMVASTSCSDGGSPQLSQDIPTTHICCDFLQYHSKKCQTVCQPLIEILQ